MIGRVTTQIIQLQEKRTMDEMGWRVENKRMKNNGNFNGYKVIWILVFLIVSVTLLFFNERWVKDDFIYNLLMTMAISGLTTGLYSIMSAVIERKNMAEILQSEKQEITEILESEKQGVMDILQSCFYIANRCQKYGLKDIDKQFPLENEKIKSDFIESETVYILMNDGKSFFSSQGELLKKRYSEDGKETNIVLLNYEQEDTMSVLTRKNGHDNKPDYYKDKIKEVIDYHLRKVEKSDTHLLNIYLNSNYNTLAMIVTDNYAMISLFRVSSGKDEVPHLIFDKSGAEYERIRNDVIKVCKKSRKEIMNI